MKTLNQWVMRTVAVAAVAVSGQVLAAPLPLFGAGVQGATLLGGTSTEQMYYDTTIGNYTAGQTVTIGNSENLGPGVNRAGQASARASAGVLGASSLSQFSATNSDVVLTSANNFGRAVVDTSARWFDQFNLQGAGSGSVAIRATTKLHFTENMLSAFNTAGGNPTILAYTQFYLGVDGPAIGCASHSNGNGTLPPGNLPSDCNLEMSQLNIGDNTLVWDFTVANSAFGLSAWLTAGTEASGASRDENGDWRSLQGEATSLLDAMNTAETFLTVLTPGVTLTSASGHDYSLPGGSGGNGGGNGGNQIPLPGTLPLALLGLVTLWGARVRRQGGALGLWRQRHQAQRAEAVKRMQRQPILFA